MINTPEDAEDCRGKLRGKFVMSSAASNLPAQFSAPGDPEDGRATSDNGESATTRRRARWAAGQGGRARCRSKRARPGEVARSALWRDAARAASLRGDSRHPAQQNFPAQRNSFYLDEGVLALGRRRAAGRERSGRNGVRSERREQRRQRSSGTGSGLHLQRSTTAC